MIQTLSYRNMQTTDAALIVNVSPYSFDSSIRILNKYEDMAVFNTNVDEIKVAIKNRQSRETDNIPDEERRKQKHNTTPYVLDTTMYK